MTRVVIVMFMVLFGSILSVQAQNARSLMEKADAAIQAGRYDEAIQLCTKAIQIDPKLATIYIYRGFAHKGKGELERAIGDFTEAIKLAPNIASGYFLRGVVYSDNGELDRAIADFTEGIRLEPKKEIEYFLSRGKVYMLKGEYDQAIADFTEAIRIDSKNASGFYNRGFAYLGKGLLADTEGLHWKLKYNPALNSGKSEYNQAIADFTESIKLNPKNPVVYAGRGVAYNNTRNYDQAISDLTEAIRQDPTNLGAFIERGFAFLAIGLYDRAITDLTDAIHLNSQEARAYATRGQAYAAQGKNELAASDYRKALEVNKQQAEEEGVPALLAALERPVDTQSPVLEITQPVLMRGQGIKSTNQPTVLTSRVTVAGMAQDDSGVSEVRVNGEAAQLDAQGNFSKEVLLKIGSNSITVEALDIKGNRTSRDLIVVRQEEEISTLKPIQTGKYYALVIGINRYSNIRQLATAVKDAKDIAQTLSRDFGFETKLLLDQEATRDAILTALNDYRKKLGPGDNLLIYFAGHGEYDSEVDKGYWIPVDARTDENVKWVSADDVTTNLKGIPAQHILVVSDSCYSGTIARDTRNSINPVDRNRYLQKMSEGRSRMVMSSGGKEPVADGGGEGHSVFAQAFLNGLKDMDQDQFSAEELFSEYVKIPVAGKSDQVPEYNALRNSGHEKGGLVFIRRKIR